MNSRQCRSVLVQCRRCNQPFIVGRCQAVTHVRGEHSSLGLVRTHFVCASKDRWRGVLLVCGMGQAAYDRNLVPGRTLASRLKIFLRLGNSIAADRRLLMLLWSGPYLDAAECDRTVTTHTLKPRYALGSVRWPI